MRTHHILLTIAVFILAFGGAQAGQWDDAIQFLAANGPPNSGVTNLALVPQSVVCPGNSVAPEFGVSSAPISAFLPCHSGGATVTIDIDQFARQGDVLALQAQQTRLMADLAQTNQALHTAMLRSDQGVAMSMAMAGTTDLQTDEHFAVSANWGTYQGQNGAAFGVAYRVADHLSVNGGFAGSLNGGAMGGRAGIRFGW